VRHYRRAVVLDPAFALARERAEEAELRMAALAAPPGAFARRAMLAPGAETALDAVAAVFVPGGGARDAAAEALGNEGLGRRAILDLIFRRP